MTSRLQTASVTGIHAHKADHFIPVGPGVYHDIQHFLFREAYLLDHERYGDWVTLLAEDLVYRTAAKVPNGFNESYASIRERIGHLAQTRGAGGDLLEQPRRFITNIIVSVAGCCDEYDVLSYLLITPARDTTQRLLSAERHDRLRRAAQSYRLVQREISVDPGARAMPAFL